MSSWMVFPLCHTNIIQGAQGTHKAVGMELKQPGICAEKIFTLLNSMFYTETHKMDKMVLAKRVSHCVMGKSEEFTNTISLRLMKFSPHKESREALIYHVAGIYSQY